MKHSVSLALNALAAAAALLTGALVNAQTNIDKLKQVNHPALTDGAWSRNDPGQVDQGKRYPTRYVSNRSFRRTSKCFLSLLLCKDRITKAKGKAPKVHSAARKSGSRLLTFPRGDTPQGVRYQTLTG